MRRSQLLVTIGVSVLAFSATAGAASAKKYHPHHPAASNDIMLDSYETNNDGFAGSVSSKKLPAGTNWIAEVTGTISYYSPATYSGPVAKRKVICGTPDAAGPLFPSPDHLTNKPSGQDAEFIFARPAKARRCGKSPMPWHWGNFQISRGHGFAHRTVLGTALLSGGRPTSIAPDHKYLYPIKGIGKPAQFRLKDRPRTSDNYGQFHIVLRGATAGDCANGGYHDFGYADEASCAVSVAG